MEKPCRIRIAFHTLPHVLEKQPFFTSPLNRSEYKTLENTWKKALEEGKEVTIRVKPIYEGQSVRPKEFKIDYSINGKKYSERLINYSGGK
ncbi:DNA/RNA non-specific endonuclease [Geobacillus sp. FSL W8-0032]|uniref:DNA/RNA non-specific endonuclease n=1 Tax=unclassified Geobacillus TaxID=2642459 RepID=UPI0009EEDF9C